MRGGPEEHESGKVVSPTHRPSSYSQGDTLGTYFSQRLSRLQSQCSRKY